MQASLRIASFVLAWACVGCVGLPPPPPGGDGSGSTSTSSDTTGLQPVTTAPVEDTSGTGTSSSSDTTAGVSVTDGTTSVDPSTSGSTESISSESSSGAPPPIECVIPGDCNNNETCNAMGQCVPACDPWGDGNYDYCLNELGAFDTAALCGASHLCVIGSSPIEVATCASQGCTNVCDCGAPPLTGNAVVTCDNFTMGDMTPDCFLSCANGELCPDGMECRVGTLQTYCAHPVQPLAMYGNCGGVAAPCANGGTCVTSGSHSVCISVCPGGIGDCDPAPPGADLGTTCNGIISPPAGDDCYLPCNAGGDCPAVSRQLVPRLLR